MTANYALRTEHQGAIYTPDVDFVVCTHNNRDVIGSTLSAIANQGVHLASCTVVDGVSTDGTPDFVRDNYSFTNVVVKDHDSGPAASRNIGMARGSAEWIALVDSDVELEPHWIEKQIDFMQRESIDVACGKLVYASDPAKLDGAYGAINRLAVCWNGGAGRPAAQFDVPKRCMWAISAAIILRRSTADMIGGFDEEMFAAHEDSDFGWRANLYGLHVGFNPEVVALHKVHGTMNRGSMGTRMTYLLFRNRLRSALVNYETRNLVRYLLPYLCLAMVDVMLRGPRWPKLQAFSWNVSHLRDTLQRRHRVQSKRKVSDRELWSLFEKGIRGPGYNW